MTESKRMPPPIPIMPEIVEVKSAVTVRMVSVIINDDHSAFFGFSELSLRRAQIFIGAFP